MEIRSRMTTAEIIFKNLQLLEFDFVFHKNQHNIEFSGQMFKKSNPKGMAAILYFLLTTLKAEWKSEFTICWFPYTQKDQKEFKQIAYTLIQKMQSSGTIPARALLGKSILDAASGSRLWQLLRILSDVVLQHSIIALNPSVSLPFFYFTSNIPLHRATVVAPTQVELDPQGYGLERNVLERNIKACLVQIRMQCQLFKDNMRRMVGQQEEWAKNAEFMSQQWHQDGDMVQRVRNQAQNIVMKVGSQQIFTELSSVDRIPQINTVRDVARIMKQFILNLKQNAFIQNLDLALGHGQERIEISKKTLYGEDWKEIEKEEKDKVLDLTALTKNHTEKMREILPKLSEEDNKKKSKRSLEKLSRLIDSHITKHKKQLHKLKQINSKLESEA